MTPWGISDDYIDILAEQPIMQYFLSDKPRVTVCFCNDGKEVGKVPTPLAEAKVKQHQTSFKRLWRDTNVNQRNRTKKDSEVEVTLVQISFREAGDVFVSKLAACDLFFMAGFTNKVPHVEDIFREGALEGNRMWLWTWCLCRHMPIWGVCGSAVALGCEWTLESRNMDGAQLFGLLGPYGKLIYSNVEPTDADYADKQAWHITSGTAACVVLTPTVTAAAAFRTCAKTNKNKWTYDNIVERVNAKMQQQIQDLAGESTLYYGGPDWQHWGLDWKTGDWQTVPFLIL